MPSLKQPSIVSEHAITMVLSVDNLNNDIHFRKGEDTIRNGVYSISDANYKRLKYPAWTPTWDPKHQMAFSNPKPFKHTDRGYFGDPTFDSLLSGSEVKTRKISPKLGTEVSGVQLSSLTSRQKDDLALLVEQRGLVVFRGQDFKDQSFEDIKEWGRYFGPLHVHPTSGAPLGHPEFHITFRRGSKDEAKHTFANKLNNITWHSDVTYENQTPGITLFGMLQTDVGGDTQFLDTIEAYERLSPTMQKLLDGLQVLHTSRDQANNARNQGGIERKTAVESIHPLVRYHPVLKKKALFVNRNFSRRILGMKEEESDVLLSFLVKHIETCLDAHVRAQWDENTIVVWDNRRLLHTATLDWDDDNLRHAFRVTTLAERPVGSEEEFNEWTEEIEEQKLKNAEEDLSLRPYEYYEKYYETK
ncbi:hypothetical protein OGAPHI_004470 [Ogataea philodendri]|uniref:TauD/TfdA-like domain-containing protein n=1 Tax=Ogataea philodendri TaxID=1378263 RepID=A0A9P8P739_9ASCO|nr:uncharacterized protein OGAPHI_004470 [Ogataea philodendri]KAH3666281.1 hypothetical protein OGAPHI_004470 [Ogataea philodendri]